MAIRNSTKTRIQLASVDVAGSTLAFVWVWWLLDAIFASFSLTRTHVDSSERTIFGLITIAVVLVSSRRDTTHVVGGLQLYSGAIRSSVLAVAACAAVGYVTNAGGQGFVVSLFVWLAPPRIAARWCLRQFIRRANRRADQLPIALLVGVQGELELALKADGGLGYQPVSVPSVRSPAEVVSAIQDHAASAVVLDRQIGSPADFRELVWVVEELGCRVMVSTPLGLMAPNDVVVIPTSSHDLMVLSTASLGLSSRLTKRALDLVLAPLGIAVTLPILIGALVATLFTAGMPVLYRSARIGKGGRPFMMFKVRTIDPMHVETSLLSPRVTSLSTPKLAPSGVTRVGKFLRRWSIDELPQLFQVVSGSMSLVGPRPRLPEEHADSALLLRRLNVRPGLTGLWQISGRGDLALDEAAELDVRYVDSWSVFQDIVILARTAKSVFSGVGAR